jgi:rare lipoprotein A
LLNNNCVRRRKIIPVIALILTVLLLKACSPDHATWYGGPLRGKLMANGRPFNPDFPCAASWDYPLGTKLKIIHAEKSVIVEVTDRGGEHSLLHFGRTIDLSRSAFSSLANPRAGSIRVKIVRVQ